jgi:hypothetical protein
MKIGTASRALLAVVAGACGGGGGGGNGIDAATGSDAPIADASPDGGGATWVTYQRGDVPNSSADGAIMLSNISTATHGAGGWSLGATSVTANVIYADETVLSHFERSDSSRCLVYDGVTAYTSEMGATPITLASGSQQATATWNGTRYTISGLVAGPAYANTGDAFAVTAGSITDGIDPMDVPAFANLDETLGAPAGLATEVRVAASTPFDVFYVFVVGTSASTGEAGALCELAAADMPETAGVKHASLLDPAAIARFEERGISPTTVLVALYRTKTADTGLFPSFGAFPLQAGQMLSIPFTALAP